MNEIRIKDLLQAKVLGCLDAQENEAFLQSMKDDSEFPWQEFGQYQNLVAHMPTLLEVEIPDPELKNKVLKEFQDQSKPSQSKIESEQENIPDLSETIEVNDDEDLIIEEEEIIPPDLQQKAKVNRNKAVYKDGISFREPQKPDIDINAFKTAKNKLKVENKYKQQKNVVNKELSEKRPKNYVSKFEKDEKVSRLASNKLLTIAGVVIVIILTFLLIMYLGLSSEIDKNKNEIERLKKRIGLTLIYEKSHTLESQLT
jgi:hypothetical protein